jgi:membrane-associated protease RseP (regulator of RpoE activity)
MLFWLLLLGLITYFIVQRSVAGLTRTPTWILWLVMMTPALIWSGWTWVYGEASEPPLPLIIGPFVICPILYWLLIQWGRIPEPPKSQAADAQPQSPVAKSINDSPDQRANLRPIDKIEESQLQSCFPWSIYYLQNIEYRPQAVICRGHLRTSSAVAYETIRENIERQFGDRFLVVFQEGLNGKPFFALVPNPQAQQAAKGQPEKLTRPILALALLVITLFTTTLVGTVIAGVPVETGRELIDNPALLLKGLPYALSLITILGIHELGHYLTARFYRIRTTLPYFIPVPFFLGTFGAFIQMRSPVPNRKVLFDVGIAGPLAGLVVTLPFLWWGLAHSSVVALSPKPGLLDINALNPGSSLLLAVFSKLALGSALTATTAIKLHPVAVAGCLGLIVTALNLMPVGQLDGGHIVHAMFGQRAGAAIGQIARLLVLALALIQSQLLLWAIILFFMPIVDEPALNDVSELDNRRDLWGLLALGLLLLIILPAPKAVIQLLGV